MHQKNIILTEQKSNKHATQPRDLDLRTSPINNDSLESIVVDSTSSTIPQGIGVPDVPIIIGIASQTVVMNEEGAARIDVVLNVTDSVSTANYDIRVAKGAGNI